MKYNLITLAAFMAATPLLVGKHSPPGAVSTSMILASIAMVVFAAVGVAETIRAARDRRRFPVVGVICAALLLCSACVVIIC